MAVNETTVINKSAPLTVTLDGVLLLSMTLTFKTTHRVGMPAQDIAITITYADGTVSGVDLDQKKGGSFTIVGEANVVGIGKPLSETTYNALVSDLQAWLTSNT